MMNRSKVMPWDVAAANTIGKAGNAAESFPELNHSLLGLFKATAPIGAIGNYYLIAGHSGCENFPLKED